MIVKDSQCSKRPPTPAPRERREKELLYVINTSHANRGSFFLVFPTQRHTLVRVSLDCLLSLKNGMASPQPVFLKNDEFLAPDAASGDIVVKRGTTVTAACPGKPAGNNFIVLSNTSAKVDVLQLQCVSQRTFRGGGWTGDFGDVKCRAPPLFTGQATGARCFGGHRVARYEHPPLPVTGDEGDRPPPRLTTEANNKQMQKQTQVVHISLYRTNLLEHSPKNHTHAMH
ncbi:hypothetical protein EVAR_46532_1 [Eumeta japonica]|uniref:Uncharacterized protein n=1 Tax=Eumeta variegata TaxID=151549 RepID=A0A4C1XQX9_EUMVA|nr:hypothetical protein EVAR_46532_1 [Eumeta japonica]